MKCFIWNLDCDESSLLVARHLRPPTDNPRCPMLALEVASKCHNEGHYYDNVIFDDMESWYRFVSWINDLDDTIKTAPKDEWGFPILEEWS